MHRSTLLPKEEDQQLEGRLPLRRRMPGAGAASAEVGRRAGSRRRKMGEGRRPPLGEGSQRKGEGGKERHW